MSICELCKKDVYARLHVKIPAILKKRKKFKNRVIIKLCFDCVRTEAKYSLDPNGYWYQFVFPHSVPINKRKKY